MASDRFVVLGLATVRSVWTRDVTGWAMSGALPIDFVKCMSTEEMKARLRSGRMHSAILCDARAPGVDRDLFALAPECGTATVVIGDTGRDWLDLGATALMHEVFGREDLLATLEAEARPIRRGEHLDISPDDTAGPSFSAQLIAVTGRGGSGVSTTAMAIAQGFGSSGRMGGLVLLADFALEADQAMLHDATDIVPGLQEVVDAHRTGRPSNHQLREMTFAVPHRRYDLLLGLRRHRDWVTLRPRAFEATLDGLRRSYRMVVADITADFEGEESAGSVDIEERNVAARTTAAAADLVMAVGTSSLAGVHGLVRTIDALIEFGVPVSRIQPVVNHAPRSQRGRADLARSIADLVNTDDRRSLASPIHLAERRHLDDAHRNGTPLPDGLCSMLLSGAEAGLQRSTDHDEPPVPALVGQTRIVPGTLGASDLGSA